VTNATKRTIVAALAGAVFAAGLALGGMTQPAKVIAFLDVTGAWDPSLAFVMGGAIAVHIGIVRWVMKRGRPSFDERLHLPDRTRIDAKLVLGSAVFGVGWGLSGYCPGPALVGAGSMGVGALAVTGGMVGGMILYELVTSRSPAAARTLLTDDA